MDIATLKTKGLLRAVAAAPAAAPGFPFGLGASGLHEVAEAAYGDRAAMTGFILAATRPLRAGAWLWISQTRFTGDQGQVPEAALRQMTGGAPQRLSVTVRTLADALWAVEEAVVSGAVSLVIAEVEAADFTATRRLTLASGRHGVPVILLMPQTREGATAAATRWRISPRPSAPNRYDPLAPGHPRWRALLERCRTAPNAAGAVFDLEWNDETLSLGVVSGLAAGPASPRPVARETGAHRKAG
ncbi:ImuA family protein [Hyphomonas sp.]|uniref:ImuA family protein n=1 Tax=Hyphomonas sp. TaxID=87 RepID=UPI00391B4365